ncbi:MAG TPA: hypothetical protein VII98_10755 [Solirubrobacteraceae bacterium]
MTYANVMATTAVFIALGGVSYAAVKLPQNSVGTKQIQDKAVTKPKVDPKLLASLNGQTGPQGATGATGQTGAKGDPGPVGPTGTKGARGGLGDPGVQGDTGPAGPTGATGQTGAKGDTGPAGTGFIWRGDWSPLAVYVTNDVVSYEGSSRIATQMVTTTPPSETPGGPWALMASKGSQGDNGATGLTGARGPTGDPGPKGDTGAAGPAGPSGPKGDTGDTGAVGPRGPIGLTGAPGPTGDPGPKGDTGATGASGPKGDTGAQGLPGVDASRLKVAVAADEVNISSDVFASYGGPSITVTIPENSWLRVGVATELSSNSNGSCFGTLGARVAEPDSFNGGYRAMSLSPEFSHSTWVPSSYLDQTTWFAPAGTHTYTVEWDNAQAANPPCVGSSVDVRNRKLWVEVVSPT